MHASNLFNVWRVVLATVVDKGQNASNGTNGFHVEWSRVVFDKCGDGYWADARLPSSVLARNISMPVLAPGDTGDREVLPGHKRYINSQLARGGVLAHEADKQRFEKALQRLPQGERTLLLGALKSLLSIDNEDTVCDLVENLDNQDETDIIQLGIQYYYNQGRTPDGKTLANIQRLERYLKQTPEEISIERILTGHRLAMEGVDGMPQGELGKVRDEYREGDETVRGITIEQLNAIKRNPYIQFEEHQVDWEQKEPGKIYGVIVYPDPLNIKNNTLKLIKDTEPELFDEIRALRRKGAAYKEVFSETDDYKKLTQRLVRALTEERVERFKKFTASIPLPPETLKDTLSYIREVSYFYRDIMSIHPLSDGNGRTIRHVCLYDLLDRVGISRPRLNNPDDDLLLHKSDWAREVERGILGTNRMFYDLARRIENGLADEAHGIEYGFAIKFCADLVLANIPPDVYIHRRYEKRKKVDANVDLLPIDGAQYLAYVNARFELDDSLYQDFMDEPLPTLAQLRDDFKEFIKETCYWYMKLDGEEGFIRVQLVDLDTYYNFGEITSFDLKRWEEKIRREFQPELNWRGVPNEGDEVSDDGIIDMFRTFTQHTVCNGMVDSVVNGASHEELALEVCDKFDLYNYDVISKDLYLLAQDHIDQGPRYEDSYGLSTSKKESQAKGFATAEQTDSGILVGAFRANKDVDLSRFKGIDEKFSCTHGRQQEVMAVGAMDPDAVMVVKRVGKNRKVEESFVRDVERPDKIWKIKGDFDPTTQKLSELDQSRIISIISLD